jgi:hypothetical protein
MHIPDFVGPNHQQWEHNIIHQGNISIAKMRKCLRRADFEETIEEWHLEGVLGAQTS